MAVHLEGDCHFWLMARVKRPGLLWAMLKMRRVSLGVFHGSFQFWDHKNPHAPSYRVKWAVMEMVNRKALSISSFLPSVKALKSGLLHACSLSLDARQANTGPGIRRERGGITAERFTAKSVEAAVWQSQPPDWHSRVLKVGHLQSWSPWEGGETFQSWLLPSLHSAVPPAEFVLGCCSLKASQLLWEARLEAGSSSAIVMGKWRGKCVTGNTEGNLDSILRESWSSGLHGTTIVTYRIGLNAGIFHLCWSHIVSGLVNASREPLFHCMQEANTMDFVVCGEFTKLLSCCVAGGLSSQLAMDGYEGPSLIFSVLAVLSGWGRKTWVKLLWNIQSQRPSWALRVMVMESLDGLKPSEFEPIFNPSLISSGITGQPPPAHISQPVCSDCFSWDNCISRKIQVQEPRNVHGRLVEGQFLLFSFLDYQ